MPKTSLFYFIAIVIIWFFTPLYLYDIAPVCFSIVGCALLGIGVFILHEKEMISAGKEKLLYIVSILLGLAFYVSYDIRCISELNTNGIVTETRSFEYSYINLKIKRQQRIYTTYRTENNLQIDKSFFPLFNIEDYSNVKRQIPIIYSKNHPNIARLMTDRSDIKKYTNREAKLISLNDLQMICESNNKKSETTTILKEYSPLWSKTMYKPSFVITYNDPDHYLNNNEKSDYWMEWGTKNFIEINSRFVIYQTKDIKQIEKMIANLKESGFLGDAIDTKDKSIVVEELTEYIKDNWIVYIEKQKENQFIVTIPLI